MSSVFNTVISGINAINMMINDPVSKSNRPRAYDAYEHVLIEKHMIPKGYDPSTASKIQAIYDDYNDFITDEKRKTNAKIYDEETKIEYLQKIEDLLSEKSNIFYGFINGLYKHIKYNITSDQNNTNNEMIKNQLSDITFSIKDFDNKLNFLEQDIKKSIINNIKKVNQLIDKIHDITIDIRYFPIARMKDTVKGLIEQRERLVDELNTLIGVKVIQGHDSYKVCLNNNMSLIDNNSKQNLIPLTSDSDNKYISIGYIDLSEQAAKKIENVIPSAILGSLFQLRKQELTNTRNKIGQLTVMFADCINEYHKLGYDMIDNHDKQIFNFNDPEIIASSSNTSATEVNAKWYNTNEIQDTDYIIYFKNNTWTVTRMIDGAPVLFHMYKKNDITSMTFDGMQIFIEGENADGDIYMIKPYSKTLQNLKILENTSDPFSFSSTNKVDSLKRDNTLIINKFHEDLLLERKEKLDESYQKFSKSIAYKSKLLEENLPFKKNMIKILENKKLSISQDINESYHNVNYEQESYLANVRVLEVAEKIFNEIIDKYS